jgi:CO dehydrogenase/acetyl-CoA synthase alpha subunit
LQKIVRIVLEFQSRNYVVILAGDFNLELKSKKMKEIQEILPQVIKGESGFLRNGGRAK